MEGSTTEGLVDGSVFLRGNDLKVLDTIVEPVAVLMMHMITEEVDVVRPAHSHSAGEGQLIAYSADEHVRKWRFTTFIRACRLNVRPAEDILSPDVRHSEIGEIVGPFVWGELLKGQFSENEAAVVSNRRHPYPGPHHRRGNEH